VSPSRLLAWLARVPPTAARLELRHEGLNGVVTLAAMERAEAAGVGNVADTLIDVAQDFTDSAEARCRFSVVWLDSSERVIATKPIRCAPTDDDDDDDDGVSQQIAGAGRPPKEEATSAGIVAQLMRHVENRERLLNIALGTNLKLMHDQLREARAAEDQLRAELKAARARVRDVEEAAGTEVSDAETEARAAAYVKVSDALVQHLIPLAAARLREGLQ
jgi:hypothetical protein